MINILSYIGMSLQTEVCMWTLLGLFRTIFDATLFKVNANLKQVWQMSMPPELSLSVQRVLRTMISGVMLVQCFTVYVYLASYIVILYPVFLEERPTLLLPWLLLAAIRKLLCELISLALGLGTCVLLGPAKPPCIKFVILKLVTITPTFYMWMLVLNYYHTLKIASAFKTFTATSPVNDNDYGLELAIRRRRTKSLQGEDQLRKKIIASLYGEQGTLGDFVNPSLKNVSMVHCSDLSNDDIKEGLDLMHPFSSPPSDLLTANRTISDIGSYEDWFGSEVILPRDTDRIMEQFVLMLLRIGAYLNKDLSEQHALYGSNSQAVFPKAARIECSAINTEDTDTPPLVGCSRGRMASYVTDYPQIFMKKPSEDLNPMIQSEKNIRFENNSEQINLRGLLLGPAKTVSLDTVKDTEDHTKKPLQETLIVKEEESNKSTQNNKNNHTNTSRDSRDYPHNIKSNESLKSVINRMKLRAAMVTADSSERLEKDRESLKKPSSLTKELKRKYKNNSEKRHIHDKPSDLKRKR